MALSEYTSFVIRKAIPRLNLPAAVAGVIVHVHSEGEAYEVELFDTSHKTIGVETVMAQEILDSQGDLADGKVEPYQFGDSNG